MPNLLELRRGATGFIYEVDSLTVLKCPTNEGWEDFAKENRIFDILMQHPPCPQLVTSFLRFDNGNFLEYMPGFSLSERLQRYQVRDARSTRVLKIQKLEPLLLRKSWMKSLAEGIAWLESLGLAHGDIRPENILVNDKDHVKIADFDCADFIGSEFEACIPPYGRILGNEAGPDNGFSGKLGARTEQFALGSLFNYGVEVYDDQDFGKDHGPVIVERLQKMMFPQLDTDAVLDPIIDDCWHGRFKSIAALSEAISERCCLEEYFSKTMSTEEFLARRTHCLQLVNDGILKST